MAARHKTSVSSMKKEVEKTPEHPAMTEEKKLKEVVNPGKSGGVYTLPFGAILTAPEGIFTKKDQITFRVVPPSERWQHSPKFAGESQISEIFVISGSPRLQKCFERYKRSLASQSMDGTSTDSAKSSNSSGSAVKPVTLLLPYSPLDRQLMEVNVKGMWKDEFQWVDVGFVERTDRTPAMVELQLEKLGKFMVTAKPKTDVFDIGPNGGLVHSRLNRGLTIRFPKKCIDDTIKYNLKIEPIPEERVTFCREHFIHECHDLLMASHFIDFSPSHTPEFRRPATVKLPLPDGVEVPGETCDDVVMLYKDLEGWHAVESKYKFTRNSISVDVKDPTKFIVVKTKPGRHRKMESAVAVLEKRVEHVVGEVHVFLSLQDKSWMGFVEVYPKDVAQAKVTARKEVDFQVVSKVGDIQTDSSTEPEPPEPKGSRISFSSRRPPPPPRDFQPSKFEGLEIYDGITWKVEIENELQFSPESDLTENNDLVFYKHLPESYRRFKLVPTTEEERALTGTLTLKPQGVKDPDLSARLTMSFVIDISEEAVRKFHFVPPPKPPPVEKKPKLNIASLMKEQEEEPKPAEVKPVLPRPRAPSQGAIDRLAAATRRASMPEKEAKVISGRSLMVLSKVVHEGLTLAVHLGLPDSTITGIGFDALSNNRSMSEVGYRILLYWKRSRKDKRDGAVQHLVQGLRDMKKHGVADIVEERHRENKELTMDNFLMAAVSGVDIAN